ncbi:MAG: multiheme c-type cytochrome, partial [Candidatus Thorarchaeota archaeon]
MVYYTEETSRVNKRLVAGYYLFLCLIGFAIHLGPTGSGIPITIISDRVREAHELANPTEGSGCLDGTCHSQQFNYWNQTVHSGYLIYLNETSGNVTINGRRERTYTEWNATCAPCHAINWDNSTGTPTHEGFGTNCYTCHDETSPYYSVNGTVCQTCHVGHSGDFVDNWINSAHANSLTDLRGSSHAGSDCMHCMSAEGFLDQDAELDPSDPDYNPITCPACHSVHSADIVNPAQIRAVNATELCGLCHVGSRHSSYTVWQGGAHDLTGIVEC